MSSQTPRERNPFKPGNGIIPPFVAGREKVFESFRSLLDGNVRGLPKNMILAGLRGTGKTVVLELFKQVCDEKKWIFVEREFSERFRDEEVFAEAILKDITKAATEVSLKKRFAEFGKRVGQVIKPEEIEAFGVKYKPFYKRDRVLLDDHLKENLINNWKEFKPDSGYNGAVFLYDEFHTVRDTPPNFPLKSYLGAIAYAQRNKCRYVIVLAGLPNMKTYLEEAKTYVERMFEFPEIGNLPEPEAREAIEQPLFAVGIKFEEDVIRKILEETGGYPYFIQFYCYELINRLNKSTINFDDYNGIHKEIVELLDQSFFEGRFEKASDFEQDVLFAMVKTKKDTMRTSDIFSKLSRKHRDYQTTISALEQLMGKNLIYRPKKGRYSFALPLFRNFLTRKLSETK
jgi:hypothetical protein